MRPSARLLAFSLAVFSCTACRTAPVSPPAAAAHEARVLVDLPIVFVAGGRTLPVPMVAVTIGGQRTQLIVDTGASHHVLTREFASALGLPLTAAAAGQDHAGQALSVWEAGSVGARFGDVDLSLADVAAIPGPPPFAPLGIGGFLSPQQLHPTAYAVLDFTADRLLLVDGSPTEVAAWAAKRWNGLTDLTLARANDDRKIMVQAAIEPFVPVVTELDTGGSGSEALADYVADASAGVTADDGAGVSGKAIEGVEVKTRRLQVGGVSLPVASLLVRPSMGSPLFKSLVGMDVLRGTVLAVSSPVGNPVLWFVKR